MGVKFYDLDLENLSQVGQFHTISHLTEMKFLHMNTC